MSSSPSSSWGWVCRSAGTCPFDCPAERGASHSPLVVFSIGRAAILIIAVRFEVVPERDIMRSVHCFLMLCALTMGCSGATSRVVLYCAQDREFAEDLLES